MKDKKNKISDKKWDFDDSSLISCLVDNDNKVNIYVVRSFNPIFDNSNYIETIKRCTFLFDKNIYPIIVVNAFNGGGYVYLAQYLLESLSPKTELNYYGLVRKEVLAKENKFTREFASSFLDTKKCEPMSYKSLLKSVQTIDYGESVKDTLLGPFIYNGRSFAASINEIKKKIKNPRKPTEILIYTDGYSYSATSLFLKYLQYYGGAITAGYFCNPNLDNIPYDSSLSPSSVFSKDVLELLENNEWKILNGTYNFSLSITGTQSFYTLNDFKRPLEYEVTPVDEKLNIFFDNIYEEAIKPDDLDIFINDSLKIFEKYKTQCNPNNKKLLLITDECDGKFGEHAHGGYECGDDGNWTKNCVASYCDIGYIYDFDKKKCFENPCRPEDKSSSFKIAIIAIIVGIIGVIIALFICIKINEKRRKKRMALIQQNSYNTNEGLGVEENLNSKND